MSLQVTSPEGRAFIIAEEGVRRYAYNDSRRNATFGVGHLIHLGPVTWRDKLVWGTPRLPSPMWRVNRVLTRDLAPKEAAVRKAVGRRIAQNRFDACVCLAFNIGESGFALSSVARLLREDKPWKAADAFELWSIPSELEARRLRERELFLHANYHPFR